MPPSGPTVTGNPIHVEDSAEAPVQGLCVYGRTEQVTTTGAQLLNPALYDANLSSNGVSFTNEDGSVYINGTATGTTNGYYLGEYIDVLSDGAEYVPSGGNNLAFFTIRISYSNGDPDSYTTNAFAVDKSTMSSIKSIFSSAERSNCKRHFLPHAQRRFHCPPLGTLHQRQAVPVSRVSPGAGECRGRERNPFRRW